MYGEGTLWRRYLVNQAYCSSTVSFEKSKFIFYNYLNIEKGKYQESIQSSSTPYSRHHNGKVTKSQGNITHKRGQSFSSSRSHRQDCIAKTNVKHKLQKGSTNKAHSWNDANLTLNSDVDQDTYMFGSHERSLTYRCIISYA